MYVSALFKLIEEHLPDEHAYAVDTQLNTQLDISFKPDAGATQTQAVKAMERCVNAIRKWTVKNKLKFKTEVLYTGTRQQLAKVNINEYNCVAHACW